MFQRLNQRSDQLQHHLRTTDWVRVSGEIALVGLAICIGTIINIYLSVDAAAQLDWTLADVGFNDTAAGALLLGILAGGVFGIPTYLVFAGTERVRRLDSPIRRWLTIAVGPVVLTVAVYLVVVMIFAALDPAAAAAQLVDVGPLELTDRIYDQIASDLYEPHRLIGVLAMPTALAVLFHTGIRRGVSLQSRRTQTVTVGLVLLLVVPSVAAGVIAPAPQDDGVSDETDSWVETENLAYTSADESVLACQNAQPTAATPDNVGFFGEDGYQPTATTTGTAQVRVSRIRVHPADADQESYLSKTEYRLQLIAPDGEPVNAAQVVTVTSYGTTLAVDRNHTHNEIHSLNGTISLDSEATKVHVLADIATENGSVHRYLFPLCPPTGGDE